MTKTKITLLSIFKLGISLSLIACAAKPKLTPLIDPTPLSVSAPKVEVNEAMAPTEEQLAADPELGMASKDTTPVPVEVSEIKLNGSDLVKSGFLLTKADQKKKIAKIFKEFSSAYYHVIVEKEPKIITHDNNPNLVDVRIYFRTSMDSQSVRTFLSQMGDISYGDGYENFIVGKERPEFKLFEQNRAWMGFRYFNIVNKRVLKLVSGDKSVLSQELTFLVGSISDDLLNPPITWVAKRPQIHGNDPTDPYVANYTEQEMCAYSGGETYFTFFNVPVSVVKKINSVKIVELY